MLLSQNSELVDVQADTVTIGFNNPGARDSYMGGGTAQVLMDALAAVTGTRWRINTVLSGPGGQANTQRPAGTPPAAQRPPAAPPSNQAAPPPAGPRPTAPPEAPPRPSTQAHSPVYAEDDSDVPFDDVSLDDEDVDDDIDAASLLTSALGAELIAEDEENV